MGGSLQGAGEQPGAQAAGAEQGWAAALRDVKWAAACGAPAQSRAQERGNGWKPLAAGDRRLLRELSPPGCQQAEGCSQLTTALLAEVLVLLRFTAASAAAGGTDLAEVVKMLQDQLS